MLTQNNGNEPTPIGGPAATKCGTKKVSIIWHREVPKGVGADGVGGNFPFFCVCRCSLLFCFSSFCFASVMLLVARAIRNAIRANRFARNIRNWNPCFYSVSGRFARITRISDSSIRANHATKVTLIGPRTKTNNCNLLDTWGLSLQPRLHRARYWTSGWHLQTWTQLRKIPVSVKFLSAILGPEKICASILWTPGKMRSFRRKNPCP